MKNLWIRFLLFFIKTKGGNSDPKRILIVSTTGLGDSLWATPSIENIRKKFPEAFLAILATPFSAQVFEKNRHLDEIYRWKKPFWKSFFPLRKLLLEKRFHTVLFFHASQRLALPLCASIGAGKIIGSEGKNKGLSALFTETIESKKEHEIERRFRICQKIGVDPETKALFFPLSERKKPDKPSIALHPGSKDAFKRWPIEHFIQLALEVEKKLGWEIFLCGSEKPLLEQIQKKVGSAQIQHFQADLYTFAHFLKQRSVLLSNDTGPFHLACALKVPVIGIYVPTDPLVCGPYHAQNAFVFSEEPTCTPCLKRDCQRPFCFYEIGVQKVFEKIQELSQYHRR